MVVAVESVVSLVVTSAVRLKGTGERSMLELNRSELVICICTATACCAVVCFLLFRLVYNYVQ
jgi:hypothetical protein